MVRESDEAAVPAHRLLISYLNESVHKIQDHNEDRVVSTSFIKDVHVLICLIFSSSVNASYPVSRQRKSGRGDRT